MALDPADNLFVANSYGSTVTMYQSPYTGAPARTLSGGVSNPTGLAAAKSYSLFLSP